MLPDICFSEINIIKTYNIGKSKNDSDIAEKNACRAGSDK